MPEPRAMRALAVSLGGLAAGAALLGVPPVVVFLLGLRGAGGALGAERPRRGGGRPRAPLLTGISSAKDPELPVTSTLTRTVNEDEGQHRLTAGGTGASEPGASCTFGDTLQGAS